MKLDEWKSTGKYFKYKDFNIFFQEKIHKNKKALTVLLIHGFPTASYDWIDIWDKLSESYHLVTLDMIGFGFSDKPKNFPYSIVAQADLIQEFLKWKNITSYHILCHDYGVTVAQELLARYEESKSAKSLILKSNAIQTNPKLGSIVFLNGGLFPETHRPRLIQKLLLSPIGFILSYLMNEKKFAKSFSQVFGTKKPNQTQMQDFWKLISYDKGYLLAHKHISYMKERKNSRARWVGVLQTTQVPIFLINGPADPISGKHMVDRYQDIIPNPEIHILPYHVGHYPQVESPEEVVNAYLSFMKKFK